MRKTVLVVAAASVFPCQAVMADDCSTNLYCSWKLVSQTVQIAGENTPPSEPLGRNPKGYLILLPDGRMMALLTSADRKPSISDAESSTLFKTMMAYTGRYIIDAEKFVTMPDVSWNESWTGQEQVRFYKLDGDKLFIRTAEQPSILTPGKRIVGRLEFARER